MKISIRLLLWTMLLIPIVIIISENAAIPVPNVTYHIVSKHPKLIESADNPHLVLPIVKMTQGSIKTGKVPYFQSVPFNAEFQSSRVIIDVGANEGDEVISAVESGYIVYAFEPTQDHFNKMVQKFESKDLFFEVCDSVKQASKYHHFSQTWTRKDGIGILFPFAAGDADKEITLMGHGTFVSAIDSISVQSKKFQVPQIRIDSVIKEDDVFLFKTDTQGMDYFVYLGASEFFQSTQIQMVLFELWPRNQIKRNITSQMFFDLIQGKLGFNPCFDVNPTWSNAPIVRNFTTEWFAAFADRYTNTEGVGWFDDILCINPHYSTF